jgi:uncharacterized protein with HEPN domain
MSRSPNERFDDILSAIERCRAYRDFLSSNDSPLSEMAFDAILRNLAVIGEAVRALPTATLASMPDVPWTSIAGLRNIVVHEYYRLERVEELTGYNLSRGFDRLSLHTSLLLARLWGAA